MSGSLAEGYSTGSRAVDRADVPADYRDLLEPPHTATLATRLPDGVPHQTVTWVDSDDHVLINTADGCRKVKSVRLHPYASANVIDPDDPERYGSVVGEAMSMTDEGAAEHVN